MSFPNQAGKQNWTDFPYPAWSQPTMFFCFSSAAESKLKHWSWWSCNLNAGLFNSIPSPCSTSKHNSIKLPITIFLPLAAYVLDIALSGIGQEGGNPSYLRLHSEVFAVTDNLSFPCKFKPLTLTFKVSRCFIAISTSSCSSSCIFSWIQWS